MPDLQPAAKTAFTFTSPLAALEAIDTHARVQPPAAQAAVDLLALLRPASGAHETRVRVVPGAQLPATLAGSSFVGLTPSVPMSAASLHGGWLVARVPGDFFATDTATPVRVDAGGAEWSIDLRIAHTQNRDGPPVPGGPDDIPAPCDLWVLLGLRTGEPPPHTLRLHFPAQWLWADGQQAPHADAAATSAAESFQLEFR
jgi:hypothetical protein